MTDRRGLRFYMCVFGTYLCSLGMEFWFLDLFGLLTVSLAVRTAVVLILFFAVFVAMRYRYFLYGLLISLATALLIVLLFYKKQVEGLSSHLSDFLDWVLRLPNGLAEENTQYAWIFSLFFVMAISLFVWMCVFTFRKTALVLVGMFVAYFAVCLAYRNTELHPAVLIPACLGLIIVLSLTSKGERESARQGKQMDARRYFAALGTIITVAAVVLISSVTFERQHPANEMYSNSFRSVVNRVVFGLSKSFEKPVSVPDEFHIFDPGILGLNSRNGTLGGPVNLSDEIYLEVTSTRDVLLKSRTCNQYRVTFWDNDKEAIEMFFEVPEDAPYSIGSRAPSGINPASLPDDFNPDSLQINFFDAFRPNSLVIRRGYITAVLEEMDVVIRNASDQCGATVFYPDHLRDASYSEPLLFNESASLYSDKSIPIGDSYTVRANVFRVNQSDFEAKLLELEGYIRKQNFDLDSPSHIEKIRSDYLETNVPQSVIRYAIQVASVANTPLEKALAVKKHLSENFTYSLDVPEVPAGRDFVEYFLETKEGYCVYFASAMCMMARVNGIPARFVEGFIANVSEKPSGAPSTVIVTGNHAHAWCEIYIEGIGWIPFDATPGGVGIDFNPIASPGDPTVTPTPTPTPTDKPEPTEGTTPGAETTPAEETTSGVTPSPVPSNAPTPTIELEGDAKDDSEIWATLFTIAGILIGAAAVAALFVLPYIFIKRRYYLIPTPEMLAEKLIPADRLVFLYRRCLNHLGLLGVRIASDDSPQDFAERVRSVRATANGCTHDMHSFNIQAAAHTYERLIYGLLPPSEEDIAAVYDTCLKVQNEVSGLHYSRLNYYVNVVFGRKGLPYDAS